MRAPKQVKQAVSPPVLLTASAPVPMASAPATAPVAAKKTPAPRPAPAQGLADGSLSGTVYDGTGAVVPGVTVIVTNQQTQIETATGDVGNYEFRALPAGQYSLSAQLPGFMTARIGLEIKSSQTLRQTVTLSVGSIAERVTVTAVGQPKPAAFPAIPQRIRVGGNVQAAKMISQVKPAYPQSVRDAGIEGTVLLQGIIGADGTLLALHAMNTVDPELTSAALETVRQWRYRSTLLNNVPVEVMTTIAVEFKLAQ